MEACWQDGAVIREIIRSASEEITIEEMEKVKWDLSAEHPRS